MIGFGVPAGAHSPMKDGSVSKPPAQPSLVTSAPGAYWQTNGKLTVVSSGTPTVTVGTNQLQNWEGFGGAFKATKGLAKEFP